MFNTASDDIVSRPRSAVNATRVSGVAGSVESKYQTPNVRSMYIPRTRVTVSVAVYLEQTDAWICGRYKHIEATGAVRHCIYHQFQMQNRRILTTQSLRDHVRSPIVHSTARGEELRSCFAGFLPATWRVRSNGDVPRSSGGLSISREAGNRYTCQSR